MAKCGEMKVEIFAKVPKSLSDFQVGDVVSFNVAGLVWLSCGGYLLQNSTATIKSLTSLGGESVAELDRPFAGGHLRYSVDYLQLVNRPNRLTVNDLPKIEGIQWRSWLSNELPDEVHCLEMVSGDDPAYLFIQWRGEEHETVKQAIDFCNRIADGVNKSKVGEKKK